MNAPHNPPQGGSGTAPPTDNEVERLKRKLQYEKERNDKLNAVLADGEAAIKRCSELIDENAKLKEQVLQHYRSFEGHVYVKNEEYAQLKSELDALTKLAPIHAEWEPGLVKVEAQGRLIQTFARILSDMLDNEGALNLVEFEVRHPEKGPLILSIKRKNGKTDMQLRAEAVKRYEYLRKLNPRQFAELWKKNLRGEKFDDLVDAAITEQPAG